jgi:hypothetical protein
MKTARNERAAASSVRGAETVSDGARAIKRAAKAAPPNQASAGNVANELVRVTLDELNLATFPISVLDKKAQQSKQPLVFRDTVDYNGEALERKWKVFPHPELGFPGPIDDDVLMALLELTREQGGSKKVYFSRYDLLKRLGWSINATYYNRLEVSFKKLAAVRVEAMNAFGDKNKKRFVNMGLTFIQEWKLNAETRGGERSSYVLWSDRIAQSINHELTRYLDATFYFEELTSPIERRLFRYLDNHFEGKQAHLALNVRDLSHEHLGISRQYKYISQVMQRIEPALALFVARGYLEKWLLSGDTLHVYKKSDFNSRVQLALPFLAACVPDGAEVAENIGLLERMLVERGVAPSVAARLCVDESEEHTERLGRAIRYFDAEIASGKQFANPGGFLVSIVGRASASDVAPATSARKRAKSTDVGRSREAPTLPLDEFQTELAYQNYLDELGETCYGKLTDAERERLLEGKRRDLLSSKHAVVFRRMPADAFEVQVRYMVRKDLASETAEPLDTWRMSGQAATSA